MEKATKKVEYVPYRGVEEDITKIRRSDVTFHEKYLEVVLDYDYISNPEVTEVDYSDTVRAALMLPKDGLIVTLTESVDMYTGSMFSITLTNREERLFLPFEGVRDSERLYYKIRRWLLD